MSRFILRLFRNQMFYARFRSMSVVGLTGSILLGWAAHLQAQAAAQANSNPPIVNSAETQPLPEIEKLDLLTEDFLELKASFYPGKALVSSNREIMPIILLHGWKGSRIDMDRLALALQAEGHSVLVPDLRGHGESTRLRRPNGYVELDASSLKQSDFANMVRYDLETLKSYLMVRHNAGHLNIEKLGVVGADMGAAVASVWAATDWSWPQLINLKQGRDVKSLVLISPETSFQGLKTIDSPGLNHPVIRERFPVLIAAGGQDSKFQKDASRIHTLLDRSRSERDRQNLFFFDEFETKLQGTALLNEQNMNLKDLIVKFFNRQQRLLKTITWETRSSAS